VVTGFLGAGKTTLLNRLLKTACLQQTGFIVNEFGRVGLDSLLLETADETMIELANGCLCCSIKGDLADTITALLARTERSRTPPLRRLIIETTGLADPAPIVQALLGAPLLQPFIRLSRIITVIDAVNAAATLSRFAEARRQSAFADTILITKTDKAAGKSALPGLLAEMRQSAATADIIIAPPVGAIRAEKAFARKLLSESAPRAPASTGKEDNPAARHRHGSEEGSAIRAYMLTAAEPVAPAAAEYFAGQLAQRYGARILRLKGLIYSDSNRKNGWILQAVQGQLYPPQPVADNPPSAGGSRLILITDGVPEPELQDLWASCRNIPAIDRADYAALSENPLAIPGLPL